jgi:hypothetical protein
MDGDDLAQRAADSVRQVIAEAEKRAAEIVSAAERQAEEIRARAEAEAREQVEAARRALEELTSRFGAAAGGPPPSRPGRPAPSPTPAAEEPVESGATEPAAPAPAEPPVPAEPAPASGGDDTQAARLVAMKMALDGAARDEIESELARSYSLGDPSALVDEVLAKAGK